MNSQPDEGGHFGPYGGRYVPEVLMAPIEELEKAYLDARDDPDFQAELSDLLRNYAGRPTPLYFAKRLTETLGGAHIWLKREDLLHTGAHKINNCIGQALLARRMGKRRIIAETGRGAARRGDRDRVRAVRLRVRRLHGRGGHAAAAAERLPDAHARGESAGRDERQPHAEGCDQRGDARLGHERRPHALPARLGAGRASVSDDGARLPQDHRRRGAAADSGSRTAACPTPFSRAWAGAAMPSGCSTPSFRTEA